MPAMVSSTSLFFLFPILLLTIISQTEVFAQPPFLHHSCLNDKGNYTANSSYHTNLNRLLSSLPSTNGNAYGFYNASYAGNSSDSDRVYAIGLCRGDVAADACRSCLNDSTHALTEVCHNQKEAIGWYDNCMLRYSNRSIYGGVMETTPAFHLWGPQNLSNVYPDHHDGLFRELRKLLESLKSEAAAGGSLRKFATGNASTTRIYNNRTIYAFIYAVAQCTPDLSELQCKECLGGAFGDLPKCCDGDEGGRVVRPSCNFMYHVDRFDDPSTGVETLVLQSSESSPPPPLSTPISPPPINTTISSRGQKRNKPRTAVIIIVVPLVVSVALIIFIGVYLRAGKRKGIKSTEQCSQFDFNIIKAATNNFSETNRLSRQGGYGAVYKGRLSNEKDIAVRRIPMDSRLGDVEFKNAVSLIANIHHQNLVRLLGFSLGGHGNERLLVYEFVSKARLSHIIFDPIKRTQLDWDKRYRIIEGIAQGLLYLHGEFYLHGYLNASSIFVDAEMNPTISHFGMCRFFVGDNFSRLAKALAYMAPECTEADFSVMSDVYSFGVLILEILTGQKSSFNLEEQNPEDLLSYAWKNWGEQTLTNLIDPTLWSHSGSELMMRCIQIGLLCVQKNKADRPTMSYVVLMLNGSSPIHHPAPIKRPYARSTQIAPRPRYNSALKMWNTIREQYGTRV